MVWTEQLLRVNLSSEEISQERIPRNILESYIGGKGLGVYYLMQEVDPKVDPLSSENVLILSTGPAQGTLPIAGRHVMVSKSPLSNMFIDSHVGGYIGPELKFAGYDLLIIKGRCVSPSFLLIDDDSVSINDASDLWGLSTLDTEEKLKERFVDAKVMSIGPAGEHEVRFASICSDGYRTAARGGLGMLMGSKNLKAIIIRGSKKLDKDKSIREIEKEINTRAKASRDSGHLLPKVGTSWLLDIANARDQLPTRNYSSAEFEHAEKINHTALEKKFEGRIKRKPCYRCSLACSYVLENDYHWANGRPIQHPEYESLGLLGSNLGIYDLDELLHLNHRCNELGLDSISTGGTISWFIEICERGLVPEAYNKECLAFGEYEKILDLISKISLRQGVGKILAEGTRKAAELFGNNTSRFAVNVRGLELPAWDPRGKLGMGLSYITSNVGGSHLRGWPRTTDIPDRSMLPIIDGLIEEQDIKIIKDSLVMCHFTHSIKPALDLEDTARIFSAFVNREVTIEEMRVIAQRIWISCRQFNVAALGPPRPTDRLPPRLQEDRLPSGVAKGLNAFVSEEDLQEALDIYYEKRGCNRQGVPLE
ncbi:MAG: aldehyde ferredoxin oxidoreductase family protein [Candidatus Heimdallarchaeota archaeon]|nr:aldehyde ferredoxin oxidoreductase family protein [Candidatus Heimdallarchaeota archaeon]